MKLFWYFLLERDDLLRLNFVLFLFEVDGIFYEYRAIYLVFCNDYYLFFVVNNY